jgi:hypothetical protein
MIGHLPSTESSSFRSNKGARDSNRLLLSGEETDAVADAAESSLPTKPTPLHEVGPGSALEVLGQFGHNVWKKIIRFRTAK